MLKIDVRDRSVPFDYKEITGTFAIFETWRSNEESTEIFRKSNIHIGKKQQY